MSSIFIIYLFFCVSQTREGVGAVRIPLAMFRSKYLITLEAAKAENELNKPRKYFVKAFEHFIMD